MKCGTYKTFFETISNDTRLAIIGALEKKEMSVTEICEEIKEEQSKVSHNLKCLAGCHIIEARKDGKRRIYSLNKETMMPIMEIVNKHTQKYCCISCKLDDK
jgi:ArsR family transcriptional regulator